MAKWTNSATDPAGPIQVGKFNKAIRALVNLAHNVRELSGVKGRSESSSTLWIKGGGEGKYAKPREEAQRIGEAHGWTLTRKGCNALIAEIEAAHKTCNNPDLFPVEDRRREPEEDDRLTQLVKENEAKRQASAEANRKALAAIMAKKPANAAAMIVAEFAEDESDSMTDYFGFRTTR